MIVVKIELWPHGDPGASEELGRVLVANDGTGSAMIGNYSVRINDGRSPKEPIRGTVKNFRRSLGVFKLLLEALKGCKV